MERYWREVLPLGFFVNQGASETGKLNFLSVKVFLRLGRKFADKAIFSFTETLNQGAN